MNNEVSPATRSIMIILLSSLLAIGSVFLASESASANQAGISGNQTVGSVVYWGTLRSNAKSKNIVSAQQLTNGAGGSLSVAIRGPLSGSATFARVGNIGGQWRALINDASGLGWQAPGSFYTSTSITGECGGTGCGSVTWTGNLSWNIQG